MTDEEIEKALKACSESIIVTCGVDCPNKVQGGCRTHLTADALAYINRLKANLESAVRSFTRMETLYKVKCKELEVADELKRRQRIYNETNTERIMQLEDEKERLVKEADENAALAMEQKMRADEIRKETAKEILSYVGNLSDGDDDRIKLKDYQWFTDLCVHYRVEV